MECSAWQCISENLDTGPSCTVTECWTTISSQLHEWNSACSSQNLFSSPVQKLPELNETKAFTGGWKECDAFFSSYPFLDNLIITLFIFSPRPGTHTFCQHLTALLIPAPCCSYHASVILLWFGLNPGICYSLKFSGLAQFPWLWLYPGLHSSLSERLKAPKLYIKSWTWADLAIHPTCFLFSLIWAKSSRSCLW